MKIISMDQIPVHSNGRIVNINIDNALKKRLTDMGLIQGTVFRVDGQAPLGDPIKINLRGYNLTIRRSDAKNIMVEQL
ncbi:MAG: Fe(2+) transport protein A [Candidatus Dichloromethanomonas elyunquensis]|nr:MAG: Fe(2+) transport protein A [Candidatus Dichloromethanomonas elyunquensis]